MDEETYLKERLNNQIDWYDKKSSKAQKIYKIVKIIKLLLTGSIPFFVGLISDIPLMAKIVSICGVLATLLEGYLAISKHHENWIEYRSICETLRHEKYMYLTKTGVYNDDPVFNIMVERVESIISNENINWANINNNEKRGK